MSEEDRNLHTPSMSLPSFVCLGNLRSVLGCACVHRSRFHVRRPLEGHPARPACSSRKAPSDIGFHSPATRSDRTPQDKPATPHCREVQNFLFCRQSGFSPIPHAMTRLNLDRLAARSFIYFSKVFAISPPPPTMTDPRPSCGSKSKMSTSRLCSSQSICAADNTNPGICRILAVECCQHRIMLLYYIST